MTDQQLAIKRKIHEILWGDDRVVKEDLFDAVDRIAIAWDAELAELRKKALAFDSMLAYAERYGHFTIDGCDDVDSIIHANEVYGTIKDGKIVE